MKVKVKHNNHEKNIREDINQALAFTKNIEYPAEWQFLFDNERNTFARLLLSIIFGFCLVFCCYQIYNRIQYFESDPILTNIQVDKIQNITLPGTVFINLDTEALKSYWPKNSDPNDIVQCSSPCQALIKEDHVRQNLTKFWYALSNYENIEKIYIDYFGKIISGISYKNNYGEKFKNANFFEKYEELFIQGALTIVNITIPVRIGSKINIEVRKLGFCAQQMLASYMIDHFTLFRYAVFNQFPAFVTMSISTTQYNFLNRHIEPCEKDDKITKKCLNECLLKEYRQLPCGLPFFPSTVSLKQCGLNHTPELVHKTYLDCRQKILYLSLTRYCRCHKPCVETIFTIHTTKKRANDENYMILQYFLNDEYSTSFHEIQFYDFISLLIDIGGNLGLFFGLSVVSFIQLWHISCLRFFNRLSLNHSKRPINKFKTQHFNKIIKSLEKEDTTETKHFFKIFNIFIRIVCAMLAIFTLKQNVDRFISYPVNMLVALKDNNVLFLPNIIACGDSAKISWMRDKKSKELNISRCKVDFFDLLKLKKKKNSLDELWNKRTLSVDRVVLGVVYKLSRITNDPVNYTSVAFVNGNCLEFIFKPVAFSGGSTGYFISTEEVSNVCNNGIIQIFLRPRNTKIHSILKSKQYLLSSVRGRIIIRTFLVTHFNSRKHKCTDLTKSQQCSDDCYKAKIKKLIKCRLPFTRDYSFLPLCDNKTVAKEATNMYVKIALTTDTFRECDCLQPCEERIYHTFIYLDEHGSQHSFQQVLASSNYMENFIEVEAYDLIALLCDFGNCFGLTLGLCFLTILQEMHKTLINVKNRITSN